MTTATRTPRMTVTLTDAEYALVERIAKDEHVLFILLSPEEVSLADSLAIREVLYYRGADTDGPKDHGPTCAYFLDMPAHRISRASDGEILRYDR